MVKRLSHEAPYYAVLSRLPSLHTNTYISIKYAEDWPLFLMVFILSQ
jgi:hypothetical protein